MGNGYRIKIPGRVKTGSNLIVTVDPPTKNFTAQLFRNPKTGTETITGHFAGTRTRRKLTGDLIQIEQENTPQEIKQGSANDGRLSLELVKKEGGKIVPMPKGEYLVVAWAFDDNAADGLEGEARAKQKVILE